MTANSISPSLPPVIGWSDEQTPTTIACEQIAAAIGNQELINHRQRHTDIFKFLDRHSAVDDDTTLVIQDVLLGFSSESNIRATLSRLLCEGSAQARAWVAERTTRRNFSALLRAVRCLGLEHLCEITINRGWCVLSIQRGNATNTSDWLAAVSSPGQRGTVDEVTRLANQALKEKKGFSLLRFGHCESKFAGYGTHFGWSDVTQSAMLQWGAPVTVPRALRLQSDISEAVHHASVVGIKPRTGLETSTLGILNSAAMAIALDRGILRKGTLNVDSNIHFDLAASPTFLSILAQVPRLILVTPRRELVSRFEARFGVCGQIIHIPVPGEFRVNGEGGSEIDARFAAFQGAEDQLQKMCEPGTLVLVGAGLVGKRWCMLAHQRDAVAIDMGSVLDAWTGIQSRSSGFPERVTRLFNSDLVTTTA